MDFSPFLYVTGLASLFGFIVQVMDWFPHYKETRNSIFLFCFGIFVGSLLSAFNPSFITLDFSISGLSLLLIAIGSLIPLLLMVAIFSSNPSKRSELYGVSAIVGVVFVMVLMFSSISSMGDRESVKIRNEKNRLSIGELVLISEEAMKKKNYDRALMHLEMIKSRITTDDSRYKKIETKIAEVKGMQL